MRDMEGGQSSRCLLLRDGCHCTAVFQALFGGGPRGSAKRDVYHGTARVLQRGHVPVESGRHLCGYDGPGPAAEGRCAPPRRLVFVETPSNPLLKITDIAEALLSIARESGAHCVHATTPGPRRFFSSPLNLGADIVVHSSTKYLGGHGDVTGGVVVAAQE